MRIFLVGTGAAGNKAVVEAINRGVVKTEDTIMINSTSRDFPPEYEGTKIVLSDRDTGCGKERKVAERYIKDAIKEGKIRVNVSEYSTVIIATSVEGGTGSGTAPLLAKFFNQVHAKNTHIMAFCGFEDDTRGLANTIEFFKEVDPAITVQAISNKAFMRYAGGNKFRAEELANRDMCDRIEIMSGQNFIDGRQNIDDTDILKLSNTPGFMSVEKRTFDKPLVDNEDFNKVIKKMIYESKSVKSENPAAIRMGVVLNLSPESIDAVDFSFADLKAAYGNPYEFFLQDQWDGKKEYIGYIVSGMRLPLDELQNIFNKYQEETAKVNKDSDAFFYAMGEMNLKEEDKQFDMIKPVKAGVSVDDFFKNL